MFNPLKNFKVIIWKDQPPNTSSKGSVHIKITEIKRFKKRLFGIKNSVASTHHASDPMEVYGKIDGKDEEVYFLAPEYEIEGLQVNDEITLHLSDYMTCYKVEKIRPSSSCSL